MGFFDDKYQNTSPVSQLLPFFHSCDAFTFRSILESRQLLVSNCKVFNNEKLLYLFYGKPAYKSHHSESTRLNSFLPVCFILNIDYVSNIKRIIPFDSGAFKQGYYNNFLHPDMELDLFFMRPEHRAISRTINHFYETNKNYFLYKPKDTLQYDPLDFEIESYFNLIKGVAVTAADDRKASIEIQLDENIDLSHDVVKAVILPNSFTLSPLVEKILVDDFEAELITYESYGVGSSLYYTRILDLTKDYLTRQALV